MTWTRSQIHDWQTMLIPDGIAGTRATLKIMRQVQREYKSAEPVRRLALHLCKDLRGKNFVGEVRACQQYVRDRIRYVKDIAGVETIQTPFVTLNLRQGDCDDKSVLLASLLGAIGHRTAFVAVGFFPDTYSHVYCATKIGRKWIACETTEERWDIGRLPPGIQSRMVVHND